MRVHIRITDEKGNRYEGDTELEKTKSRKAIREMQHHPKKTAKNYEGLVGGINFLIDKGFFKKLVLVTEVHEELKREGYVYSLQAVDTILRRDFVKKKKILNRISEAGVWKYAIRK